MILFENTEYDNFFNPLCCKNKRIYYECILQLIEKSKSVPLLYENDVKDTIILYLRNCTYAVEDEVASNNVDENISSKKTETENGGAILRYFRRCGWISEKEIGRNGDNIATVMPYCRKMIESIERIFNRDNRAALTNHMRRTMLWYSILVVTRTDIREISLRRCICLIGMQVICILEILMQEDFGFIIIYVK